MNVGRMCLAWVPELNDLTRAIIERQHPLLQIKFFQSQRELLAAFAEVEPRSVSQIIVPASQHFQSRAYEEKFPWLKVYPHNYQREVVVAVYVQPGGTPPDRILNKHKPIVIQHLEHVSNDFMLQLYIGQLQYQAAKHKFRHCDLITLHKFGCQSQVIYCLGGRPRTINANQRLQFISSLKDINSKFVASLPAQFIFYVPLAYEYQIRNSLAEHGRVPIFQFNFQTLKRLFFICDQQYENIESFLKKKYPQYEYKKIPNPYLIAKPELRDYESLVVCFESDIVYVVEALKNYKTYISIVKIPQLDNLKAMIREKNSNSQIAIYFQRPNAMELRKFLPPQARHIKDSLQLKLFLDAAGDTLVQIYYLNVSARVVDNLCWGRKNVRKIELPTPHFQAIVFFNGCEVEEQFHKFSDEFGEEGVLLVKEVELVPQNSLVVCYRKDIFQLQSQNLNISIRPIEKKFIKLLLLTNYIYDSQQRQLRMMAQAGEIRLSCVDGVAQFRDSLCHRKSFLFYYEKDRKEVADLPSDCKSRLFSQQKKKLLFVNLPCAQTKLTESISLKSQYQFSKEVEYLLVVSRSEARKAIAKYTCYHEANIKIALAGSSYSFSDCSVPVRREPALLKVKQVYIYNLTELQIQAQAERMRFRYLQVTLEDLLHLPRVINDKPAVFICEGSCEELNQMLKGRRNKVILQRESIPAKQPSDFFQLQLRRHTVLGKEQTFKQKMKRFLQPKQKDKEVERSLDNSGVQAFEIKRTRSVDLELSQQPEDNYFKAPPLSEYGQVVPQNGKRKKESRVNSVRLQAQLDHDQFQFTPDSRPLPTDQFSAPLLKPIHGFQAESKRQPQLVQKAAQLIPEINQQVEIDHDIQHFRRRRQQIQHQFTNVDFGRVGQTRLPGQIYQEDTEYLNRLSAEIIPGQQLQAMDRAVLQQETHIREEMSYRKNWERKLPRSSRVTVRTKNKQLLSRLTRMREMLPGLFIQTHVEYIPVHPRSLIVLVFSEGDEDQLQRMALQHGSKHNFIIFVLTQQTDCRRLFQSHQVIHGVYYDSNSLAAAVEYCVDKQAAQLVETPFLNRLTEATFNQVVFQKGLVLPARLAEECRVRGAVVVESEEGLPLAGPQGIAIRTLQQYLACGYSYIGEAVILICDHPSDYLQLLDWEGVKGFATSIDSVELFQNKPLITKVRGSDSAIPTAARIQSNTQQAKKPFSNFENGSKCLDQADINLRSKQNSNVELPITTPEPRTRKVERKYLTQEQLPRPQARLQMRQIEDSLSKQIFILQQQQVRQFKQGDKQKGRRKQSLNSLNSLVFDQQKEYSILLYEKMAEYYNEFITAGLRADVRVLRTPADLKRFLLQDRTCYLVAHQSARRMAYRACELYSDKRIEALLYCDLPLSKYSLFKRLQNLVLITDQLELLIHRVRVAPGSAFGRKGKTLSEAPPEFSQRSQVQTVIRL